MDRRFKQAFTVCALTLLGVGSAAGVFFAGAGTTLAPSPARLTTPLSGQYGASAAAFYVDTNTSTSVVKWSPTYMPGVIPAGTPCETFSVPEGYVATRVIVVSPGGARKCA